MKKINLMIVSAVASIICYVFANIQYDVDKSAYGVFLMSIGILSLVIYAVVLSHYMMGKVNNENDLRLGFNSIATFIIMYICYMLSFNATNLDVNIYNILLMLLYISFLSLVIIVMTIFHFWNIHHKRKKVLYFLTISITLIVVLLLSSMLFKNLPLVVAETVKLIYFISIILVLVYVVALAIHKIVKPINK